MTDEISTQLECLPHCKMCMLNALHMSTSSDRVLLMFNAVLSARVLQASLDAQTILKLQLQDMDMLKEKVQSYKVTRQQMQQQATLIAELRYRVHTHAALMSALVPS